MAAAGRGWQLYIGPHASCLSPFWNAQFAATASMVSALASQFLDKLSRKGGAGPRAQLPSSS